MRRDRDRERRSVVVPEWAVVHSEVSCSDWLLVSLAALCDLNIFLQKSFRPSRAPGICSSLQVETETDGGVGLQKTSPKPFDTDRFSVYA